MPAGRLGTARWPSMRHLNAGPSRAVRSWPSTHSTNGWPTRQASPRSVSATELAVVRPTAVWHSSREWMAGSGHPAMAERRGDRRGEVRRRTVPSRLVTSPEEPSSVRPVDYKGEPLDAERGPGLGCFRFQVGLLVVLIVLTPLSVAWKWPVGISVAFLFVTLVLLLFAGQTVIFLLRLVAADRRDGTAKAARQHHADGRPARGRRGRRGHGGRWDDGGRRAVVGRRRNRVRRAVVGRRRNRVRRCAAAR